MKYAVIQTGGKQIKVHEGDTVEVEQLSGKLKEQVIFDRVLLSVDGDSVTIGSPVIQGLTVVGIHEGNKRGEKIQVRKFKAKSRYRRATGHRQSLTVVSIQSIGRKASSMASEKASEKVAKNAIRKKT
jgi:large subunit ribosomal protein L21